MTNTLLDIAKEKPHTKKHEGSETVIFPALFCFDFIPKIHIDKRKADALFKLSGMKKEKGYHIVKEYRAGSLPLARWFADAVLDHDRFQLGPLADKYAPIAHNPDGPALAIPFLQNGFEGLLFIGPPS